MRRRALVCLLLAVLMASPMALPLAMSLAARAEGAVGEWSIFVYMCGADLESEDGSGTKNLMEAMAANVPAGVRVIVETGGAHRWHSEAIDPGVLGRWEVRAGELALLEELPLRSMGAARTLGDFLSWGVEHFPARRTMAVVWNHGGGAVAGVAFDELFDDDSLTLSELTEGLRLSGTTFDILGFDACLMASLETAAAVAPYARYLLSSQEYEPSGGWDYRALLDNLAKEPGMDARALGVSVCEAYYKKCRLSDEGAMATLSLVDLSRVGALVAAFEAMAAEMTGATAQIRSFQAVVRGARRAENYGGNNEREGYTNMVDLGDLAINTQSVLPNTADALLDALFAAVLYDVHGRERSNANGLSVFFPLDDDDYTLDQYARVSPSGAYLRFIEAATGWRAPEWLDAPALADESVVGRQGEYEPSFSTYISGDGYYVLRFDEGLEAVSSVQFALYQLDYETNEYRMLGLDNDIDQDWDRGVFLDNFRGVWFALDGVYCAPTLVAETDDYNIYSLPVLLNGEEANLRGAYVWDGDEDGHFELHGTWEGIDGDTGMSARDLRPLADGDELTLLCEATDWETGAETTYALGRLTVSGAVTFGEAELMNGDYLYVYRVEDVFGNVRWSEAALMTCRDGDIEVYEME